MTRRHASVHVGMSDTTRKLAAQADSCVLSRRDAQPAAAICAHWARNAHFTQAAEISRLARRAGVGEVQAWAAASALGLTPTGLVRMLRTVETIREMNAAGASMPTRDLQQRVALLRTMAANHAVPSPTTARPPPTGAVGAAAPPPWNEQRINASVDKLAKDRGVTSPALVELMKSYLCDPSMTIDNRAASLGRAYKSVAKTTASIRTALGIGSSENLRVSLAKQVGMPPSEVVARIQASGDTDLPRRVISTINASHREAVAERLLSVRPGSDADVMVYRALNAIFRGGDPFAANAALSKQLNLPIARFTSADTFLRGAFSGDRITMLRTMGFKYEQIMSMNPVGAEISRRLDPALGTYSAAEQATRRERNLPCTREDAAERLLRAGTARPGGGLQTMTYRNWLAVGLVSDKPSTMPSDTANAYASIAPNSAVNSGVNDMAHAFRVAQTVLGREIPRGGRTDLMDRGYRQEANLLLLQIFGLGATRVGSGHFESIPTNFKISDWPAPNETPSSIGQKAPRTDQGTEEVTWQKLLPLLRQRSGQAN
jgi:hypothetical protein